jgi:hypothetical protein
LDAVLLSLGGRGIRWEQNQLGIEAYQRLQQVNRLVEKVVHLLELNAKAHISGHLAVDYFGWTRSTEGQNALKVSLETVDDIHLFTECAYLIGWRCTRAIGALVGLKNFRPTGIRNARNKLIEHPDGKDSGVLISSFAWGGEQGPVLKAVRTQDQMSLWPDSGLFRNYNEFSNDLVSTLKEFLEDKRIPEPSK